MPYVAVRELMGRWEAGHWVFDRVERCTHAHRSPEAALVCLRRRWGVGRVEQEGGGASVVVQVSRPDRFYERAFVCGPVRLTWRRYLNEEPEPGKKVELDISCGRWSEELVANDEMTVDVARGFASGLNLLFETLGHEDLMHASVLARQVAPVSTVATDPTDNLIPLPWVRRPSPDR